MTITVEMIRDPRTHVLKAYVIQEGQRASTNLLSGQQLTKMESAKSRVDFKLRCRYPADLEISFQYHPDEKRTAQP